MIINAFNTARISEKCIEVHQGNARLTADDAIRAIRDEFENCIAALRDGKYAEGTVIYIGFGIDRPGKKDVLPEEGRGV